MLKFRIIARMDIRNDRLIKTVKCEGVRQVGDPQEFVSLYDADGVDEFYFNDCVASLYGRNSLHDVIDRASVRAFCPVTVAGGVRGEDDVRALLNSGADKVAINTAAVEDPSLIDRLATKFGSSTIVLQLDAKRAVFGWEARTNGGRQATGRNAVEWAREAAERGVGEIVATSVDREGTRQGLEIGLGEALSHLPVPVVLAGGYRSPADAVAAYRAGCSGVAIAGAIHYRRETVVSIKQNLEQSGVPIRCASWLPAPVASSALTSPSA